MSVSYNTATLCHNPEYHNLNMIINKKIEVFMAMNIQVCHAVMW
jgi:hypothetical protein